MAQQHFLSLSNPFRGGNRKELRFNFSFPGFYYSSKIGLCDVKMWYLDMLGEGVLHGDLNEKQQRIKTSVEKLMHSQKGTVELECETLALYQQILLGNEEGNNEVQVRETKQNSG